MGKTDFFDGLGETLTKTAKELGERAEQMYEGQKIRSKISSEERIIEKIKADLGNLVFKRHEKGEALDSELSVLCEEIQQHILKVREYREMAAELRSQKICPSCEKAVDRDVSYCPYCGAPCPAPEKDAVVVEVVEEEDCGSYEPGEQPEEEPIEEPGEQPKEEPIEEPGEQPKEEPIEESGEEPIEESGEQPMEESGEEPMEEQSVEETEEPEEVCQTEASRTEE